MPYDFTARELQLMLNSVHERALWLLDASIAASQMGAGHVSKDDVDRMEKGSDEHFALQKKLQGMLREARKEMYE